MKSLIEVTSYFINALLVCLVLSWIAGGDLAPVQSSITYTLEQLNSSL